MPNDQKDKKEHTRSPIPRMPLPKMNGKSSWRGFLIYIVLGFILFVFFALSTNPEQRFQQAEPVSKVIADFRDNKVEMVEVDGNRISVKLKDDFGILAGFDSVALA